MKTSRCARSLLVGLPALALVAFLAFLASCSAFGGSDPEVLNEPKSGKGYVAFRILKPDIGKPDDQRFQDDFRLHYRPISLGPLRASLSSTRLGDHVDIEAGSMGDLLVLELDPGGYVFHAVVSSLQKAEVRVQFNCVPGQLSYIGDLEVYLQTELGPNGLTHIGSASLAVRDRNEIMEVELDRRYPSGHPQMTTHLATPGRP